MLLNYPESCTAEADTVRKTHDLKVKPLYFAYNNLGAGCMDSVVWFSQEDCLEGEPFFYKYQTCEKNKADIFKISTQYTHPGRVSERMFPVSWTAKSVWADTGGHVGPAGRHRAERRIRQRKAGQGKS